ncbi:MAG: 4Fe-4S binding protein, partial [Spirochaetales bacterium]|nr:4Fe-4S binding protein [Spirochaetales bacterium]
TSVLFRRSFCGTICPLGTLQELFGRLGRRLLGRRHSARLLVGPQRGDRAARLLKYLVLAVFTGWAFATATLAIRPYDPWAAYHHLFSADLFTEFAVGFGVLVAALAGSLLVDRLFCKYLCPMGAFLGLISRASLFKVRRNPVTCIDCGACDRSCPVNIEVSSRDTVHDWECINCNECVNSCPVPDTLRVTTRRGRRLGPTAMLWLTAGIFTAVIAVTTLTGTFAWTVKDIRVEAREAAGFNPNLITGRNSLSEIAEAAGLPLGMLQEAFGVSDDALDQPLKEIKDAYGFDTEEVRELVIEKLAEGR